MLLSVKGWLNNKIKVFTSPTKITITLSSLSSCVIPSRRDARVFKRYDVFSRFIVGIPNTKETAK